jgi:PAS domain S-box-containing protein
LADLRELWEDLMFEPGAAGELIEAVPDGLVIVRADGTIVLVNRQLETLFGYERSGLLGQPIEMLLPAAVRVVHRNHREEYARAPKVRSMGSGLELSGMHHDGHEFPVEISLSPLRSSDEGLVVATIRDVSDRRAAEIERRELLAELQASEEQFRLAFDQAPVAMALTSIEDPNGREILQANQALADLLGRSLDNLAGQKFSDLTHPDDRADDASVAAAMLAGTEQITREKRYLRADGQAVWVELHAASLVNSSGDKVTLGHMVDITDRKQREFEEARQTRFLDALAQVTTALLAADHNPFDAIARHGASLVEGHGAIVVELDPISNEIATLGIDGAALEVLRNVRRSADGAITGGVITSQQPRVLGDEFVSNIRALGLNLEDEIGSSLVVPLSRPGRSAAALVVVRRFGAPMLEPVALDLLTRFASQAAVALELAEARSAQQRLAVAEDRERIARDLHDRVIQRLFGVGMGLESMATGIDNPSIQRRCSDAVEEIDRAIKELRTAIFTLNHPSDGALRSELVKVVEDKVSMLGFRPSLSFDGAVDHLGSDIIDHAAAVLTEALSNVARHARASRVDVHVRATASQLTMDVVDNGVGIDENRHVGNGLANMNARANHLGGTSAIVRNPDRGSTLRWTIKVA